MEIAAVPTGAQSFCTKQLTSFILNGRIVHDTHMRRKEGQIFLLPDLADAAFPVGHIVFRHGKINGVLFTIASYSFLCFF